MTKTLKMTLIAGCIAQLAACAGTQPPPATLSSIDEALNEAGARPADRQGDAPASISEALMPEFNLQLPDSSGIDTEPRFDIKVNRADARRFFMELVEGTPHNMVMHPDVDGRLTLDLKNVTVADVMEVVRDVYGYDYDQTRTGFKVFPNTLTSRIFSLDYLDIKRKGVSNLRVSSGQVTENAPASGSGRTGGLAGGGSNINQPGGQSNTLSGSSINTESESDFWKGMESALKTIVGNKEGRNVVVNRQSGLVVVNAMPAELRAVERFIKSTQDVVQRQVILEAKIIEVELNDRFQSGINWSALHDTANNSFLINQTGGGSIFGGSGVADTTGSDGNLNPSALNQVDGSAASAFGGVFSMALNVGNDFAAFIELLETQGDVQVLSSPKVSTINNQKAVIKVGEDEFFITDVASNTDITTGTSTTSSNVELTPFFSGVALDVIPQISEDGNIILHIHPSVSTVTEKTKNISVSSNTTFSVPLAISTIRESDSIIRARSGQVVVIGGLMQDSVTDEDASVPLLGDLPLIGGLFRHTREVTRKSELIILLKPVLVEGDETWSDAVRSSQERIRRMRNRQ
ncbi:MAG: pilus (MSHA type) biogenesis protein MshL [Thiohalophilus sp.]|uniref:pilus (MSHA type) biogenesis protein MshL n=1 Tax=Thiohalophilus sp. TaxID=3028392 RepID=UPI0028700C4D|nr:pilus (MSHA type) biogenesis protein MshL [Thiohalophilus sp.]MDR9435458.1 pilus (MSHA type) biogenesis protein MshL [Thiohalophilus sp.]